MKKYRIRLEVESTSRKQAIKEINALFAKIGVDPFVEPFDD